MHRRSSPRRAAGVGLRQSCGVEMRLSIAFVACTTALAACAPFPELDAVAPDTRPPPTLLPIDTLLDQAQVSRDDPGPALVARAAGLKARAAAIKAAQPAT